jgi:hypothetical protein
VSDVCASAPDPHICSRSQDYGFGSAVAANKEDVKSYLFFGRNKKERKKFEQTVKFLKLTNFRPNFRKL